MRAGQRDAVGGSVRAIAAIFGAFARLSFVLAIAAAMPTDAQTLPDESIPVVAVGTVLNEVRCDYLEFARSDHARRKRLAVGKVTGTIHLSLSRDGTRANMIGVPVAPAALRIDPRGTVPPAPDDTLALPVSFDPALALNPDAAGLDCGPRARLGRPVLEFTGLAAALAGAERTDAAALRIGSPVRYRGQFYLRRRDDGEVDVVLARADPARLGADAIYLQSFDLAIESGTPSWFADADAPPAAAPAGVLPSATAIAQRPRVRVPTAPRPLGSRRVSQGRCIADPRGAIACY